MEQRYGGIRTKSVNKLVVALGLISSILCTIAPGVSATNYSGLETLTEEKLLDPANNLRITSADVSISPEQVTFNCVTDVSVQETGAPLEQFGTFIGGTLGLYIALVNAAPEVGDLLIIMKNRDQPTVATLSCPKSWITGIDLTDADAVNQLMMNVLLTMKEA